MLPVGLLERRRASTTTRQHHRSAQYESPCTDKASICEAMHLAEESIGATHAWTGVGSRDSSLSAFLSGTLAKYPAPNAMH